MSPSALQVYACTQTPPLQFVEQHSEPAAHAFPRVVQVAVPVGTWAQALPVQMPEQHWLPSVQPVPMIPHAASTQRLPVQAREQHSLAEVQSAPALLQNADEVHCPVAHTVEQHSVSAAQPSPPTLQAGAGGAAQWRVPSQTPEQHCPGLAAVQAAPVPRHWPAGSTQIPFAHAFVQQFASEPQAWPTGLHVAGGTQVPVQARLQHSVGAAQAVPSVLQTGAGPQVPPALHWFVQHSPAPAHWAPSLLQVCAVTQKPPGHEAEQHSEAATHAAPFGWQAVAFFDLGQPAFARARRQIASAAA